MKASVPGAAILKVTSQLLLLVLLLLRPFAGTAQTVYTWTGGSANTLPNNSSGNITPANRDNINLPDNWAPRRTSASPTDFLVFNGATVPAPVVSIYNGFTVAQLQFINGVNVTLVATNEDKVVTITGPAGGGQGLLISGTAGRQAASSVLMTSVTGENFEINLTLASAATADIDGTLILSGASASTVSRQRLEAATANAFVFQSGSFLRVRAGIGGDIGENSVPGSIVMQAGATYVQEGGPDPFNSTDVINEVTKFLNGSTYRYVGQPGQPNRFPNDAHQYGNLVFDVPANSGYNISVTGTPLSIINDLTLTTANTANVNIGSESARVGGNLTVQNGSVSTLDFNGGAAHRLSLVGTSPQTLSAPDSQLRLGATTSTQTELEINNGSGVVLNLPLTLNGKLVLTNGFLTTSATNLLTLTLPPAFSGGVDANLSVLNNSFINGPLARVLNGIQTSTILLFPVGKTPTPRNTAVYRPVRLALTQVAGAATYTVEEQEGVPTARALPSSLVRVSRVRYFHVARAGTSLLMLAQIRLSYGTDDAVTSTSTLRLAQGNDGSTTWTNQGGTGNSIPSGTNPQPASGTITSTVLLGGTGTTAFGSDFVLASSDAATNPLGANPLPVTLTSFTAERRNETVALAWQTASEKDNAFFEVQRSADGFEFQTIGTVLGQGNNNSPRQYAWQDEQPTAGANYYRLRQVDTNESDWFSLVRIVEWDAETTNSFSVYPTVLDEGPLHYRYTGTLPPGATLCLYGPSGQKLSAQPATTGDLVLPTLATGWYSVRLTAGRHHFVSRFYQP